MKFRAHNHEQKEELSFKVWVFFPQGGSQVEQKVKSKAQIQKLLLQFGCHKQTKKKKYFPTYSNPHVSDPHLTGSNAICLLYEGIGQTKISIHTWGLNSLEQFGKTREDVA